MLHHPLPASTTTSIPSMQTHPRVIMLVFGAIIGVVSGVVLGLFALIASKIVKK
jgi:uncharacterized membrane protein